MAIPLWVYTTTCRSSGGGYDVILRIFCQTRPIGSRTTATAIICKIIVPCRSLCPSAGRFMTILEIFYESVPQTILQVYIYLRHSSKYFTLFDICLSLCASVLNIVFNMMEIVYAARTRGMYVTDYLLYFMSGQLGNMLSSGVPVKRALRNTGVTECDISGYCTLYRNVEAMRRLRNNIEPTLEEKTSVSNQVNGWKRLILPRIPKNVAWTMSSTRKYAHSSPCVVIHSFTSHYHTWVKHFEGISWTRIFILNAYSR